MRWRFETLIIIILSCIPAVMSSAEELQEPSLLTVKKIFILPMKDRMDHLLTNELVRWGHFEITVNPTQADAFFSDATNIDVKGIQSDPSKIRKSAGTARGTVFLIDIKTEKILWSTSQNPSDHWYMGGSKDTRELAAEIVAQLKKDISKSK